MSLTVIVPSKGRPANAKRLAEAFAATSQGTRLIVAVDDGDPQLEEYAQQLSGALDWVSVRAVTAFPQRMGPVLNGAASLEMHREGITHIGFMGDDHLPRTSHWDELLVEALGGKPGVAYGNDLIQGEKLPTACVISADIVRALGFMCPPTLEHLYIDDFWKMLGLAVGNLAYCPDVVIEHLHPTAGKAFYDQHYLENNNTGQYARDHAAYQAFLAHEWDLCLESLKNAGIIS